MKFKFKNTLLVSFLAIAGILGVSSALINKQVNQEPVAEKAEADASWIEPNDFKLRLKHLDGSFSYIGPDSKTDDNWTGVYNLTILKGEQFNFYKDGDNWIYGWWKRKSNDGPFSDEKFKQATMVEGNTSYTDAFECNETNAYNFYFKVALRDYYWDTSGKEAPIQCNYGTWNGPYPEDQGFFLLGNNIYTGSDSTAWKFAGGVQMTSSDGNRAQLLNKVIDVEAEVRGRAIIDVHDFMTSSRYINSNATDFVENSGSYNLKIKKKGSFNFYWTNSDQLSVACATYTITFNVNYGSGGDSSQSGVMYGNNPTDMTSVPTRTGYTFGGYYDGEGGTGTQYFNASGESTRTWDKNADTNLYAKWTPKSYNLLGSATNGTLKFYSDSERTTQITSANYDQDIYWKAVGNTGYNDDVGQTSLCEMNFTFANVSTAGTNATFKTTPTCSAKTSSLTFILRGADGGGAAPTGKTATYGSAMPTYGNAAPTKTGYTFGGFYDGSDGSGTQYYTDALASARTWDKDTTSGTELYAKWTINEYTYTTGTLPTGVASLTCTRYSSPIGDGATGTLASGATIYYGDELYWSATASTGYTITTLNYNSTSSLYTVGTSDVVGVTATSVAATINKYTVSFNMKEHGSQVSDITNVSHGSKISAPTAPTATGYDFGGWYKENALTNAWNFSTDTVTSNKTLYAKWTATPYTISYSGLDGATITANPTSYTIETTTFTLNNPTKDGYTFKGWSGTGLDGDSNKSVSVALGSTENRSYTANWTLDQYTLTLTVGTGIDKVYYKINGAGSFSYVTSTTNLSVNFGSTYYLYATAKDGYILSDDFDDYTSSSPYSTAKTSSTQTWAPTTVSGETAAINYAKAFNTSIGGTCKNDGSTSKSALATAWGTQSTNYSGLASHVKYWLNASHASSDSNVASMFAKYDYVYGKYHDDLSNNDFLKRNPTPLSAIRDFSPFSLFTNDEDNLSTIIIIVASSVALLSVTALSILVIKKRKNKEE